MHVSVVIPAYNEEGSIPHLMSVMAEQIQSWPFSCEVVLVDDGSTDATLDEAKASAESYPFLHVLSHPYNKGLTAALRTGIEAAKGEAIVFLPADLQYLPEEVPTLVEAVERGADVVCGWKEGVYDKGVVSFVYNRLSRLLFGVRVHDLNSVKAFRREVVSSLNWRRDWHRYLVVLAAARGFRVDEVRVQVHPRRYGESKFAGPGRVIVGLLDLISVKFYLAFAEKPMLFFGSSGGMLLGVGFVLGLWYGYVRLAGVGMVRPSITLVALFILAGLLLVAMGFIGELILGLSDQLGAYERRLSFLSVSALDKSDRQEEDADKG
jgi:glycosyltransferase involved in cell wall biosynthesis